MAMLIYRRVTITSSFYIENMIKHEIQNTNIKYDLSVRIDGILMTTISSVDHINNIDNAEKYVCMYVYIYIIWLLSGSCIRNSGHDLFNTMNWGFIFN